jgi:uncharacterized membrane protein
LVAAVSRRGRLALAAVLGRVHLFLGFLFLALVLVVFVFLVVVVVVLAFGVVRFRRAAAGSRALRFRRASALGRTLAGAGRLQLRKKNL